MQGLDAMAGLATQGQVDPKLYVQKVIEVYEKAERLNQNSFGGEFKEALDKAATAYINKNKACEGNKVFFSFLEKNFNFDQDQISIKKFSLKLKNFKIKTSLPAELVARYCDTLLKKSNRTIDDSSLDEKFNQGLGYCHLSFIELNISVKFKSQIVE